MSFSDEDIFALPFCDETCFGADRYEQEKAMRHQIKYKVNSQVSVNAPGAATVAALAASNDATQITTTKNRKNKVFIPQSTL